jgi:hypothetical protein
MDGHLIHGTYELFRHFCAVPTSADVNSLEVGAVRGVLTSLLSMIELPTRSSFRTQRVGLWTPATIGSASCINSLVSSNFRNSRSR